MINISIEINKTFGITIATASIIKLATKITRAYLKDNEK